MAGGFNIRGIGGSVFRLDRFQIGFMESGVSMTAASHDAHNRPVLGRVTGCRVGDDGRVTVFVARSRFPFLLDAVRRSGVIAVSFNEASTHKSIQVKGEGAEVSSLAPGDAERIAGYFELFIADLDRVGESGAMARAVLTAPAGDFAAMSFTPVTAFIQTPGAQAGSVISGSAASQ